MKCLFLFYFYFYFIFFKKKTFLAYSVILSFSHSLILSFPGLHTYIHTYIHTNINMHTPSQARDPKPDSRRACWAEGQPRVSLSRFYPLPAPQTSCVGKDPFVFTILLSTYLSIYLLINPTYIYLEPQNGMCRPL